MKKNSYKEGFVMNRLLTEDLSVGYQDNIIVNQMNIQFSSNEITTIIGPNGCGKSTLLKAITRIIPHSKGSILLEGQSIVRKIQKSLHRKWQYCRKHKIVHLV